MKLQDIEIDKEEHFPYLLDLMLTEQVKQGNPRSIGVFINSAGASRPNGGFDWSGKEGSLYYDRINNPLRVFLDKYTPSDIKDIDSGISPINLGERPPTFWL